MKATPELLWYAGALGVYSGILWATASTTSRHLNGIGKKQRKMAAVLLKIFRDKPEAIEELSRLME